MSPYDKEPFLHLLWSFGMLFVHLANRLARRKGFSQEAIKTIWKGFRAVRVGETLDNAALIHACIRTGLQDDLVMFSAKDVLWDEIQNRLLPEYDGEEMRFEDWGWWRKGQEPIVYFPEIYHAETGLTA